MTDRSESDTPEERPKAESDEIPVSAEVRDILKKCEALLSQQHARLSDFARAAGGWFWETDGENRFSYMSPSVTDITGVAPEWHYGKTRQDIGVEPEMLGDYTWSDYLETIERREPFSDFVFLRAGPDGEKWMRTSGIPVFDENGAFTGYRGAAQDVTKEISERLRAERLTRAIYSLDESLVMWDQDDRLLICNQKFKHINRTVAETTEIGTRFEDHIRAALDAGLFPQAAGREHEWLEWRLDQHRNPGDPIEVERQSGSWLLLSEQRFPDGTTLTRATDISRQKQLEHSLRKLATVDPLTGLKNRRAFLETAERQIASRDRYGFIILDVDHFKSINDRYGHLVGDEALKQIAETIDRTVGSAGIVGRMGGEEFAAFLPGANGSMTKLVAEAIREAIEQTPIRVEQIEVPTTVSVGAANVERSDVPLIKVISAADRLLYEAKHSGRNTALHDRCNESQAPVAAKI